MIYLVQCSFCGTLLFKSSEAIVATLNIEIKCPNANCKKLLRIPQNIVITLAKGKKGLDKQVGLGVLFVNSRKTIR